MFQVELSTGVFRVHALLDFTLQATYTVACANGPHNAGNKVNGSRGSLEPILLRCLISYLRVRAS